MALVHVDVGIILGSVLTALTIMKIRTIPNRIENKKMVNFLMNRVSSVNYLSFIIFGIRKIFQLKQHKLNHGYQKNAT